jgi:hypothetical protein
MKPLFATSLLSFTLATCACSVLAQEREAVVRHASSVTEQAPASFEDQVEEYIRRFPYQMTYDSTVRFTGGDPRNLNRWVPEREPALVRAGNDIMPRTNNDTYYKGAALYLKNAPVILESSAPAKDRFNSFQLVDDRNANYRNIVFPKGKYTLYFGERPTQIEGEAIEVPSALSVVIARVEVRNKNDPKDTAAAKTVYNGMKIHGVRPDEFPQLEMSSGYPAEVVAEANRRMDEVFATVPFSHTVVSPGKVPGRHVPYLYHAAGTKGGWGGPDPGHSAYDAIFFDEQGREMRGSDGTYVVTTAVPPVDAFWSVTVYDTQRGGHLHPNKNDRYHINDTTAVRNRDDTVTFTFKLECDSSDINCLDVPAGRFDVTIRYYLPRQAIVSGAWKFPKIGLAGMRSQVCILAFRASSARRGCAGDADQQ